MSHLIWLFQLHALLIFSFQLYCTFCYPHTSLKTPWPGCWGANVQGGKEGQGLGLWGGSVTAAPPPYLAFTSSSVQSSGAPTSRWQRGGGARRAAPRGAVAAGGRRRAGWDALRLEGAQRASWCPPSSPPAPGGLPQTGL